MQKTKENIIRDLNSQGGTWTSVDGVHALTQVSKEGEVYNFNPAAGVVVKIFINTTTGEIKLFPALSISDSF